MTILCNYSRLFTIPTKSTKKATESAQQDESGNSRLACHFCGKIVFTYGPSGPELFVKSLAFLCTTHSLNFKAELFSHASRTLQHLCGKEEYIANYTEDLIANKYDRQLRKEATRSIVPVDNALFRCQFLIKYLEYDSLAWAGIREEIRGAVGGFLAYLAWRCTVVRRNIGLCMDELAKISASMALSVTKALKHF